MKHLQAHVSRVLLNPIVLISVALVTGIIGFAVVLDVPTYAKRLVRAERLTPTGAAALAHQPMDREVMIEARIDPRNPRLHQNFVAYVREEYRDEILDGDTLQRWVEVKRETPPLLLSVSDGEVTLVNTDYTFDTTAVTVEEAAPTFTKGAVQVRGYAIDSPVLVIGRVAEGGTVDGEFLYAGNRAGYIAEMRRLATRSLPVGLTFLLVSAVAGIAFVRETRRFLREIAAERLQEEPAFVASSTKQTRTRRRKH